MALFPNIVLVLYEREQTTKSLSSKYCLLSNILIGVGGPIRLKVNKHVQPVKRAIWDARAQWKDIGRALDLPDGTIRAIHESNDGENLHEVLTTWIVTGNAMIHQLLDALEDTTVSRRDIADEIRSLKGEERKLVGL